MIELSSIHIILHHDDPDGGLAALTLRRAIRAQTGYVIPLARADYHSRTANSLHEINVLNPAIYTVDIRLFPGIPGMDHHDSSQAWFDPSYHILDLTALSCFSLMLDTLDRRRDWPTEIVQYVDWMDSGSYPNAALAVGLESLGQQFLAIYAMLPHEWVLAELWQRPDAEVFVRAHEDVLEQARRWQEIVQEDMKRRSRVEGRVVVWDSSELEQQSRAQRGGINPFLLCALFPEADYTIRLRSNGHMTIGHNPWAHPTAHVGALCETLEDPVTHTKGGGKAQVGGAPATAETLQQAIQALNEAYKIDRR